MHRTLKAEELRAWAQVAASVRPLPGRAAPKVPPPEAPPAPAAAGALPPPARGALASAPARPAAPAGPRTPGSAAPPPPEPIEPLRRRRIARGRDSIGQRLDLHGYDQDRARRALHAFLLRAHAEGFRAVLVITGKGALGDGVLRRRVPEWLADPQVRAVVAGVAQADRRHGGAGALYVALKRRPG